MGDVRVPVWDRMDAGSIYLTNFPSHLSVREIRAVCERFGEVVDLFVPPKKSKAGKFFAFVRFSARVSLDAVVGKLCQTWVGKMRLQANIARFKRPSKFVAPKRMEGIRKELQVHQNVGRHSFAEVLLGKTPVQSPIEEVLTLDDECINPISHAAGLVCCVNDFGVLPNLRQVCVSKGFADIQIRYLGGYWILVDFENVHVRDKFKNSADICSWFYDIRDWTPDFVLKDRVAWVDVEGVPMQVWSDLSFQKIAKRWGSLLFIDGDRGANYYCNRLCVSTAISHVITESFNISFKGMEYSIRAREVPGWIPTFVEHAIQVPDKVADVEQSQVNDDEEVSVNNDDKDESVNNDDDIEEREFPVDESTKEDEKVEKMIKKDYFHINHLVDDPVPLVEVSVGYSGEDSPIHEQEGVDTTEVGENEPRVVMLQEESDSLPHPPGFPNVQAKTRSGMSTGSLNSRYEGFSVFNEMQKTIQLGKALGLSMKGMESDLQKAIDTYGEAFVDK